MCPNDVVKIQHTTKSMKPAFDALDADRDGKISAEDLRVFYSEFGSPNEETIRSMMSSADENEDGFVEYDEFERVIGTRKFVGGGGFVEEMFKLMDGDEDGKVGCEDLRRWLREVGMAVSEEEIVAMLRLDGGDGVTFDGLRRILGFDN